MDHRHVVLDQAGDRHHLGELLHAGLRLTGLGRLRLEPIDEALQMRPLGILLHLGLGLQHPLLGQLLGEGGVAAAIDRQLPAIEMQDVIDGLVQQVAVVRDDDRGARIALEIVVEPDRALDVEVVGRLVEQQQVGLREQHRGQRHAHPPAAGEVGAGPALRGRIEAEPVQDRGGAGRRRMRADIDEPRLDLGAPKAVGPLRFRHQARTFDIGGEDDGMQRLGAGRRLLRHRADAHALGHRDRARIHRPLAEDRLEQGGLAGPVAADETDAGAIGDREARAVEDQALADAEGEVVDAEHGAFWRGRGPVASAADARTLRSVPRRWDRPSAWPPGRG